MRRGRGRWGGGDGEGEMEGEGMEGEELGKREVGEERDVEDEESCVRV